MREHSRWTTASSDAAVMHLILAAMPQPEVGLRQAVHVLKHESRVAVLDRFLPDDDSLSLVRPRRIINIAAAVLF